MTTYSFPNITPSSTEWELINNTKTFRSPLTNAVQTATRKGSLWRVSMRFNNLDGDDRAVMQAFLVKLNGQEHRFTLADDSYTMRGSGGGTPLVNGGSQTGSAIVLDGATASVTNWLRAGDYLSFNGQLFMSTSDVNSDGSGNVTAYIAPPMRSSPADNLAVDISAPVTGTFMLANNPGWNNQPGIFSSFTLEAVEDVLAT